MHVCFAIRIPLAEQRHYLIVSGVREALNFAAVADTCRGHPSELSGSTLLLGQMRLDSELAPPLDAYHLCELNIVVRASVWTL